MKKKNSQSEKDNRPVTIQSSQRWKSVSPCLYRCFSFFAIVLKPQQAAALLTILVVTGLRLRRGREQKKVFVVILASPPSFFSRLFGVFQTFVCFPPDNPGPICRNAQTSHAMCNVQGKAKTGLKVSFFFSEQASFLKLHQERESLGDFFVRNLIAACS